MFVDLHLHESTYSHDSKITLIEIVDDARAKGLDGVCITDHDSMGLKEYAHEYSIKTGFPIFVGVEYYSLDGDIVAFGIDSFPDCRVGAQEFIDYVSLNGGFCIACHPFRNNNRGLAEVLKEVRGLNGVEVLNGSTSMEANRKALSYCEELGLCPIGASDAHCLSQLGKYVTWLPEYVDNIKDFVSVLKSGKCKPAIREENGYRIVDKF